PPPAPSAWPRAFARAAKSCGVRGTLTTIGFAFNIQTGVRRWTLTSLRSGPGIPNIVRFWTLTSLRSGLGIPDMVKCFKSGRDLFVSAQSGHDLS
ncbi:MAG: hypothetical protein ABSH17_15065, partial [Syntrophobacteraceae bacterium]